MPIIELEGDRGTISHMPAERPTEVTSKIKDFLPRPRKKVGLEANQKLTFFSNTECIHLHRRDSLSVNSSHMCLSIAAVLLSPSLLIPKPPSAFERQTLL